MKLSLDNFQVKRILNFSYCQLRVSVKSVLKTSGGVHAHSARALQVVDNDEGRSGTQNDLFHEASQQGRIGC